jgi:hypothetical protein
MRSSPVCPLLRDLPIVGNPKVRMYWLVATETSLKLIDALTIDYLWMTSVLRPSHAEQSQTERAETHIRKTVIR